VRAAGILIVTLALLALAPAAPAEAQTRRCQAIEVRERGNEILTYDQVWAITHPRRFGDNAVLWTSVRRLGCDEFRRLIVEVLLAPDELVALRSAGWRVTKIDRLRVSRVRLHQVHARRGGQRLLYVRRGRDPVASDFDAGRPYRPGQDLGFYRSPGEPDRRFACTSGYVLRQPLTGTLYGLTAGHCSRYPFFDAGGRFQTEDAERVDLYLGKRRRTALGSVISNHELLPQGPDALLFALYRVRWAAQEIDRGHGDPHRVVGLLPTHRQRKGQVVCFTGRTTGSDRCGRIYTRIPREPRPGDHGWRRVTCARVKGTEGDSGGPVYTRPDKRGEVRAVGIVTATRAIFGRGDLCFTPIEAILIATGAELPTGAFAVPPPPPPPPGQAASDPPRWMSR
jgi:hypothetical protein